MYRVIDEYMSKVTLQDNAETKERLDNFLRNTAEITSYNLTCHFEKYSADIHIKDFSVEAAAKLFQSFLAWVSYEYSSLYVRYNEGSCVRYRFLTSREDKNAIYCDIMIR